MVLANSRGSSEAQPLQTSSSKSSERRRSCHVGPCDVFWAGAGAHHGKQVFFVMYLAQCCSVRAMAIPPVGVRIRKCSDVPSHLACLPGGVLSHWVGMLLYAAALILYTVRLGGLQTILVYTVRLSAHWIERERLPASTLHRGPFSAFSKHLSWPRQAVRAQESFAGLGYSSHCGDLLGGGSQGR